MLVICILRIAVSFKIFFPLNVLGICQPVNMKEVAFINNIRQALYFPLALLSDLSPTLHWSPRELPWLPPGSSELVSQGGSVLSTLPLGGLGGRQLSASHLEEAGLRGLCCWYPH